MVVRHTVPGSPSMPAVGQYVGTIPVHSVAPCFREPLLVSLSLMTVVSICCRPNRDTSARHALSGEGARPKHLGPGPAVADESRGLTGAWSGRGV